MSAGTQKKKLIVLTGAGISAESGLQTFRDGDGLWENYRIEEVATPEAWERDPELVLRFYNMRRENIRRAQPNLAHLGLAQLEQFYEVDIITQNIDDLHECAGSTRVTHLHGEIFLMRSSVNPSLIYPIEGDILLGDVAEDGSQLRPHIVWFGEPVPMIEKAIPIVASADIFVLVGSSMVVYPAAGLIDFLPINTPRYILNKKTPHIRSTNQTIFIEKPATEGIKDLMKYLQVPFSKAF